LVAETEVGIGLRNRTPFHVIGIEQARPGAAVKHELELPRQIVRILNTGIHSKTPVGRKSVRSISDEEDETAAKLCSHLPAQIGTRSSSGFATTDNHLHSSGQSLGFSYEEGAGRWSTLPCTGLGWWLSFAPQATVGQVGF
jgi:hypothetical protein